jgi:hypothetical protein
MTDHYVGPGELVWSGRRKQPVVLDGRPRHERRAILPWSGVRMAYETTYAQGLLPSAVAGGRAGIEKVDVVQISEVVELLDQAIWPWAAFEIPTNQHPPVRPWLRLWCTSIANPGRGRRLRQLVQGSVYMELEPTSAHPGLTGHQLFHLRWARVKETHLERRKVATDPSLGRFLQNEREQRSYVDGATRPRR